jgi:hypothetical protein
MPRVRRPEAAISEGLQYGFVGPFGALEMWAYARYDYAIEAGFIHPPYFPDSLTVERMRAYFHAGLSPADAACACFTCKH